MASGSFERQTAQPVEPLFTFEILAAKEITQDMIQEAAALFSRAYGIWGPQAEKMMGPFAEHGRRVRMSPSRLREECLPDRADNYFVRAMAGNNLVGHALATYWNSAGHQVCWVTQLCVDPQYRRRRLATRLLSKLREGRENCIFGILSSHPAAILTALRSFGCGLEEVDLRIVREHAKDVMESSPVRYIRSARLSGSLFVEGAPQGVICCADTNFWVDHGEPTKVLAEVRARGLGWPFGDLPDGHEYLLLVKTRPPKCIIIFIAAFGAGFGLTANCDTLIQLPRYSIPRIAKHNLEQPPRPPHYCASQQLAMMTLIVRLLTTLLWLIGISIVTNIVKQLFFRDPHRPPVVWHWVPLIGSTVDYGQDPYKFFFKCREKYGDFFTFGLLGMKVTVYLGAKGNNFILNGKLKDLNAEEVYGPLTVPVFGRGVVYDVDNARFMDQKRLLKEGFTSQNLRAYVPQFVKETEQYINTNAIFQGEGGVCDISTVLSEISLYAAAGSLQGKEVRDSFDSSFATYYRHLDDGFAPANFMFPWLPTPVNRRRDRAQRMMAKLYMDIIRQRRSTGNQDGSHDMLWALMDGRYRDGTPLSDEETANLMIALLMGGQHNTAASGTWIMLHLAHRPHLIEELYQEQLDVLGDQDPTYDTLQKLTLHNNVIKETLRLHSPIHSIMRKVKQPMPIPDTDVVVPAGHILLAAPGVPSRCEEFFPDPMAWNPHRWDKPDETDAEAQTQSQLNEKRDDNDTVDYGYGAVSSKAVNSPYLPFGAGRHRCVGETFAYAQLGAILATMVRLLRWEQVDPSAPVPATDYSSMFSRPMHPATIKWQRRH
ncbi:hypothetical protein AYO21_05917 [Fonsecaea monophora]|uniref:sterol 14alpha-demethylase n=1 Tax=Fonsecaea monophora TaxID=254056 RepID=A0A177F843_9EURO|nr:hypothetical protein AYO21_05917 [Fonsecaea monophora]OAG39851.1 hypothetical protein AYO21_05917 [Fonsecaea monophora]